VEVRGDPFWDSEGDPFWDPEGTHFLGGYLRVPWGDPFLNLRGMGDSKRGPMFLKEF